jgi:hypothetical protein
MIMMRDKLDQWIILDWQLIVILIIMGHGNCAFSTHGNGTGLGRKDVGESFPSFATQCIRALWRVMGDGGSGGSAVDRDIGHIRRNDLA